MKGRGLDRTDCKSGDQRFGKEFRCPHARVVHLQPLDLCPAVLTGASVQNDRPNYLDQLSAVTPLLPHDVLRHMPGGQ